MPHQSSHRYEATTIGGLSAVQRTNRRWHDPWQTPDEMVNSFREL
jgi:hypothetical protein